MVDGEGQVQETWTLDHDAEVIQAFLGDLQAAGGPAEVLVGMEPGATVLVESILEKDYPVYLINPKQVDRFRDRYFPSGSKDDARDAEVIANAVRTDSGRLPRLLRQDELTEEIQLRSRARQRLVEDRVALGNRLEAVLGKYYPLIQDLKRSMDDPFLLEFLKRWPDPESARTASKSSLGKLLAKHRNRVLKVDEVYERMQAPGFPIRSSVTAACRDEAVGLRQRIEELREQIAQADAQLEALLERHPDSQILHSLPGMGRTLGARVGTGFGANRLQILDSRRLQGYGGSTPVTRSTGSRRKDGKIRPGTCIVHMRRACNRPLQTDLQQWARASCAKSRWARAYLQDAIARGVGHNTALRSLASKWVKILAALVRSREVYDEEAHIRRLVAKGVPWAKDLLAKESENQDQVA
jgi:transposase